MTISLKQTVDRTMNSEIMEECLSLLFFVAYIFNAWNGVSQPLLMLAQIHVVSPFTVIARFFIQYDASEHCYDMCICRKTELGKDHTSELFQRSIKLPLYPGNNHVYVCGSIRAPSQYKVCLFRYGYFHDKDRTVARPCYFYNRNSYTATTVYIETGLGCFKNVCATL